MKRQFLKVKAVFFDIDDTFSSDGKILPEAYSALWKLSSAGIVAIPVTGRPAGWCDHIARMWPVSAIVGENGAFYCYVEKKPAKPSRFVKKNLVRHEHDRFVKVYLESKKQRLQNKHKLEKLHQAILKKFPDACVPSDQPWREFDLAIDYREDVPRWPDTRVHELMRFCKDHGADAKLSSIHVNIWFGKYDKWTCVKKILKDFLKIKNLQEVVYLGDSPNDEPFFKELPVTVGVANIKRFLNVLEYKPAYITQKPGGLGFAEFVETRLKV